MSFSVIIATYNRSGPLLKLVNQVLECVPLPDAIIVVDSSDTEDHVVQQCARVVYVQSSHKNQPYQRYVGYLVAKTDILVFFDDDLQILNRQIFARLLECYLTKSIDGVSGGIDYRSVITSIVNNDVNADTLRFKILNFISGVPLLKPGKIYMAGLAGPKLKQEGKVDYFHGPFMSFRRNALESLYDPTLFTLFENKMGVAEDKAISMKVGLRGTLWYLPDLYLEHPPVESHYFSDLKGFSRKTTYFRLFLSGIYSNLTNIPYWIVVVHYVYFMFWRILISSLKYSLNKTPAHYAIMKGQIEGFKLAIFNPVVNNSFDWRRDAHNDAAAGS